MDLPDRFLDLTFPLPYFDIECESEASPSGFEVTAGHLKEAFFERGSDGAYLLPSVTASGTFAIRAIEVLGDGVIKSVNDHGEVVLLRIRPFQLPS